MFARADGPLQLSNSRLDWVEWLSIESWGFRLLYYSNYGLWYSGQAKSRLSFDHLWTIFDSQTDVCLLWKVRWIFRFCPNLTFKGSMESWEWDEFIYATVCLLWKVRKKISGSSSQSVVNIFSMKPFTRHSLAIKLCRRSICNSNIAYRVTY